MKPIVLRRGASFNRTLAADMILASPRATLAEAPTRPTATVHTHIAINRLLDTAPPCKCEGYMATKCSRKAEMRSRMEDKGANVQMSAWRAWWMVMGGRV